MLKTKNKKTFFGLCLLLLAGFLTACGNDETAETGNTEANTQAVTPAIIPLPSPEEPVRPEMNRFTPIVLAEGLDEPMTFEVAADGRVYFIERKGGIRMYNPETQVVEEIGELDVNIFYTNAEGEVSPAEEGLVGFSLDPDFEENNQVYFLYADPDEAKHVLSRFELVDNQLQLDSEIILLEYDVQRQQCCHTGGGMAWDDEGNFYMTIGNNTSNSQGSQTDERTGRLPWDDQRGSANTNDLRGKIIRIHPEDDGTYTIPDGNLFPPGMAGTRPEIYAMGLRNPWRVSLDERGFVYWGEVGPDNLVDSEVGPRGYDEFNQAREPGFFGWPYFVGNNQAFPITDYVNDVINPAKDPQNPTNLSSNNDGLTGLPPVQQPLIWYPYEPFETFPLLETGSRSAVGGPFFYQENFADAERPFPAYYEGKWFITDFTRNWIMAVSLDEEGNYESMERFLPSYIPTSPIDMDFGPNGDLYLLEYGSAWFQGNPNSRIVRIEYNSGNRRPEVHLSSNLQGGVPPFEVSLSSAGSIDFDGDELSYDWQLSSENSTQSFSGENPDVIIDQNGVYTVTLTISDPAGLSASDSLTIVSGNEAPEVTFNITDGNQSFFFPNQPFTYAVTVRDAEDGRLEAGDIDVAAVGINIEYVSEGFDYSDVINSNFGVDVTARDIVARRLMDQSFCFSCHQLDTESVGPRYTEVAERYAEQGDVLDYLSNRIRNGGSGVWGGEVPMPPHPTLSANDATQIATYILGLNDDDSQEALAAEGTYTPLTPDNDNGQGGLILRAVYQDQGVAGLPPLSTQDVVILQSNNHLASQAPVQEGVGYAFNRMGELMVVPFDATYIAYPDTDLTGINSIALNIPFIPRSRVTGGALELRLGNLDGEVIGQVQVPVPEEETLLNIPIRHTDGSEITGQQDLYLIFNNDGVREIDFLMNITTISFLQ